MDDLKVLFFQLGLCLDMLNMSSICLPQQMCFTDTTVLIEEMPSLELEMEEDLQQQLLSSTDSSVVSESTNWLRSSCNEIEDIDFEDRMQSLLDAAEFDYENQANALRISNSLQAAETLETICPKADEECTCCECIVSIARPETLELIVHRDDFDAITELMRLHFDCQQQSLVIAPEFETVLADKHHVVGVSSESSPNVCEWMCFCSNECKVRYILEQM